MGYTIISSRFEKKAMEPPFFLQGAQSFGHAFRIPTRASGLGDLVGGKSSFRILIRIRHEPHSMLFSLVKTEMLLDLHNFRMLGAWGILK